MTVWRDHDCDNCRVYPACGWYGDILVQPRCFVEDKCDPKLAVPDLSALRAVIENPELVLVAVEKTCWSCGALSFLSTRRRCTAGLHGDNDPTASESVDECWEAR